MGMMFPRSFCDTVASLAPAHPCFAVKTVAGDRLNAGSGPWPQVWTLRSPGWSRAVHLAARYVDGADGIDGVDHVDGSLGRTAASCAFLAECQAPACSVCESDGLAGDACFQANSGQSCQPRQLGGVGVPFSGASPMPSQGCAHGAWVPSRINAAEGSSTIPCAAGTLRTSAKATARACTGR